MVAYILLVCIGAVGGLGLVAMGRSTLDSFRKDREQRARLAARQRLAAESRSREQVTVALAEPHARGGLAAGTPPEQPAVAMPDMLTPPPPARERVAITHAAPPPTRLERGELTGVLNLLDESARFALAPSGDLPPPPARLPKATRAPAMPPVFESTTPADRPAWANGVVPKRPPRQPEKPHAMTAPPPPPPARRDKPSVPPPPPRFAGPNDAQAMSPFPDAPTRMVRQPSAAPHVAPSQPTARTSLIRPPAPPPAQFARVTVGLPPARAPHASAAPPVGSHAPATRIPVPPAPIHHTAPGQTRLPVPPLPPPPTTRRSRSS